MPLKINNLQMPEDYIEDNEGNKFVVVAELPLGLIGLYKKLNDKNLFEEEPGEVAEFLNKYLVESLSIKNDREKVKAYVKKLSLNNKLKIANFLNAFIDESLNSEDVEKKKQKLNNTPV